MTITLFKNRYRVPTFVFGAIAALFVLPGAASAGKFDKVSYTGATGTQTSLSSFTQVYIAPVEVSLNPKLRRLGRRDGSLDRPVSERDQGRKSDDLHQTLSRRIGKKFELMDQPGPGILTVAATITKLESSRPTLADYSHQISLSAASIYAGGAAATFVISENGTDLVTVSDEYITRLNDARPRVATWSDADSAFNSWGRSLTKLLTQN